MDKYIPGIPIGISAGEWFLTFFRDFIGTPAILVGLFAMLGSILLRKKATDIITTFFKTAAGFLIVSGGATVLIAGLNNFQYLFEDLFNVTGLIPNNEGFAGWFFKEVPKISQLGSIIMVVAMLLNITLAYFSRFKYVYLSGHVLFYMSVMLAGMMSLSGLNIDLPGHYAVALISASIILSIYMVLSCAALSKWTKQITKVDNITVAHTGALSYIMGGLIGELIYKIKKGKNIKNAESINFPKWLQFFRNTFISMAITMIIVFFAVYIPEGIMYQTGSKVLPQNENIGKALQALFGPGAKVNWLVQCILDAFTFAAGVEIILLGVRMIVGEIVPSFKGISDKLIKNAKAGIDCPVVFPYAPNAVLIGFVCSLIGAIAGLGISVLISWLTKNINPNFIIPIILPGIVAQFFLGATTGVYGNVKGGLWGCIISTFLNGIIITCVPIIFYLGGWVPKGETGGLSNLGWGDTDYLLGVIPGLLALPDNIVLKICLLIIIPALAFIALIIDGLLDRFVFQKRKLNLQVQQNSNGVNVVTENKEVDSNTKEDKADEDKKTLNNDESKVEENKEQTNNKDSNKKTKSKKTSTKSKK